MPPDLVVYTAAKFLRRTIPLTGSHFPRLLGSLVRCALALDLLDDSERLVVDIQGPEAVDGDLVGTHAIQAADGVEDFVIPNDLDRLAVAVANVNGVVRQDGKSGGAAELDVGPLLDEFSVLGPELDALVHAVLDYQLVLGVDQDVVRQVELADLGALTAADHH